MTADTSRDRLVLTADDAAIVADGSDATRITFRAADAYGNHRPGVTGDVGLSVRGPAVLIGSNPFPFGESGGVGGAFVRSVPGKFTTIEMLTNRNAVQEDILKALEARWKDDGIIVEDVALQEIRYGEQVTGAYAAAQEAQINVQAEEAKLEASKVSAQQKVVQAQAEADANAILAASLTDAILKQRYLDTLKELAAAKKKLLSK